MTFSEALAALKEGKKVTREGWNGKGMFVYMTAGSKVFFHDLKVETQKALMGSNCVDFDGMVTIHPHLDMKSANGTIIIGWSASQTDMLANDWVVVCN